MKAAMPVTAEIDHATASWTGPVNDVEFPEGEIGIR
jgi:hypothetical protein